MVGFWVAILKPLLRYIDNNQLTGNDIKVFIGYCGWDKNELEAEITEGSWEIAAGGRR